MLPFFLYFTTGVITGFHIYTLLSLVVYGVPFDPLEAVALLGSLCLLVAAYVSLFWPYAAAKIALIAVLGIWSFYGPAIAKVVRTGSGKRGLASEVYCPKLPGRSLWPDCNLR
jgi:hypothetical protein